MAGATTGAPLRVLIIDRDDVARAGLETLLNSDPRFNTVGALSGCTVAAAASYEADVIVLDPCDRRGLDVEFIGALATTRPESHCCIYTEFTGLAAFLQAMARGARAYLCKAAASGTFLLETVFVVGRFGAVMIDPAIAAVMPPGIGARLLTAVTPADTVVLSTRERQVLVLIAQGETDQGIAKVLRVHPSTVDSYVARLCDKLEAGNRPHLVDIAWRRGLLTGQLSSP